MNNKISVVTLAVGAMAVVSSLVADDLGALEQVR